MVTVLTVAEEEEEEEEEEEGFSPTCRAWSVCTVSFIHSFVRSAVRLFVTVWSWSTRYTIEAGRRLGRSFCSLLDLKRHST